MNRPSQLETPVALLIFKRPEHTRRVFERIREMRPKQLFIIADGPRNEAEAKLCEETKRVTENIDWDCEVKRDYSEINQGCDPRTTSGISWVFTHVDRVIFFEDDDLPHPDFFPFCEELLERYKDDERVMHITGANYQQKNPDFRVSESYFFSLIPFNHGMATWRRAWDLYDPRLATWPDIKKSGNLASLFPDPAVRVHWEYKFDQFHSGKLTSWDGKWAYACLINHGLAVNPRVNLISNIGYGEGATHTTHYNPDQADLETQDLPRPYMHPSEMLPNACAEKFTYLTHFGINRSFHQRALNALRFRAPAMYRIFRRTNKLLRGGK